MRRLAWLFLCLLSASGKEESSSSSGPSYPDSTPRECVESYLSAAKRGDVAGVNRLASQSINEAALEECRKLQEKLRKHPELRQGAAKQLGITRDPLSMTAEELVDECTREQLKKESWEGKVASAREDGDFATVVAEDPKTRTRSPFRLVRENGRWRVNQ